MMVLSQYVLSENTSPALRSIDNERGNILSDKSLSTIDDDELYRKALDAMNRRMESRAKVYYQELLKRELAKKNPPVLKLGICYYQLGLIDNDKKLLGKAIPFIKKSIIIEKNKNKPDKLEIASYYTILGIIDYTNGKYKNAIQNLSESEKIKKSLDDESQNRVNGYFYLALSYSLENDSVNAEKYARKSVYLSTKILGKDNIRTASCSGLLGKILYDSSKKKEALPYVIQAHAVYLKLRGKDFSTTRNLSGLLKKLRK